MKRYGNRKIVSLNTTGADLTAGELTTGNNLGGDGELNIRNPQTADEHSSNVVVVENPVAGAAGAGLQTDLRRGAVTRDWPQWVKYGGAAPAVGDEVGVKVATRTLQTGYAGFVVLATNAALSQALVIPRQFFACCAKLQAAIAAGTSGNVKQCTPAGGLKAGAPTISATNVGTIDAANGEIVMLSRAYEGSFFFRVSGGGPIELTRHDWYRKYLPGPTYDQLLNQSYLVAGDKAFPDTREWPDTYGVLMFVPGTWYQYIGTMTPPVKPGTVSIYEPGYPPPVTLLASDNGAGAIVGPDVIAGTINYATGEIDVTFFSDHLLSVLVVYTWTESITGRRYYLDLAGIGLDGDNKLLPIFSLTAGQKIRVLCKRRMTATGGMDNLIDAAYPKYSRSDLAGAGISPMGVWMDPYMITSTFDPSTKNYDEVLSFGLSFGPTMDAVYATDVDLTVASTHVHATDGTFFEYTAVGNITIYAVAVQAWGYAYGGLPNNQGRSWVQMLQTWAWKP